MPPPPATSSSQAPPPAEGGQKPLSGLSLYAGISFSGNRAASSSSTDATSTSAPAPSTTTEASGSSPSATTKPAASSSWSAALRFAPRKSSSSSNSASAANRNRPRAAIVAPSFSSSTPNPLQVDEDVSQDEVKSSEPAAVAAAGLPGRSRSNPSPARSGSGWATVASGSAAPTQPSSAVPATATASTSVSAAPPPTVLALPSNLASSSKYVLPVVTAPPELRLPQAELDADKAMARDAAIARGERAQPQQQQYQQRDWGGDGYGGYDEGGAGGGWDEDEDVNGFAMSSAGQKARKKRSKRRRQHSPGRPPPINWDADYDPRTPNDYAAWKDVVRNRREALKRMDAQRRREAGDGGDDEEDERDWVDERDREREVDEERLRKYRKWAPPPSYATSAGAKQRTAHNGEEEEEEEKLYISPPPPERPAAPQTAPYGQYGQPPPAFVQPARPAPPSFVTASASTAEAGPSIRSPYTSQLPPPSRQSETSSTPQRPMTGEEAYQRRLAMSQQAAHASPPVIARASPVDASLSRSPLPPAFQGGGGGGEGGEVKPSPAPAMDLAARQSAAAAIAARLASIAPPAQLARPGPPPPPPPPPSFVPGGAGSSSALNNDVAQEGEEEEGDFATRLMSKWGHQSGQGLGAEGNQGMTEALVMNKVSNSKPGGWRKGPDFSGGDGFGPSGPSSSGNGASSMGPRGRYATADPRARADLEKYGQPSEVILLHGLLSPPAKSGGQSSNSKKGEGEGGDVDEALPGEIAEECAKYGYVERVAIYPHISPPLLSGSASFSPSTALDVEASGTGGVVFVVFTGLVGAYKAVRELNGRFFSGRRVRARYFPKQAFAKGEDAWREEVRGWLAGGGAGA